MATGPEAGWYDDGTGKQRWWDGSRWTDQYIDLNDRYLELRSDPAPTNAPAREGWYDDSRGRLRWWNGTRWTDAARYSGSEEEFAGIVVDGRWIHFGPSSQPVAGASATRSAGAELLKRGRLARPAVARALLGPAGPITPNLLKRSIDPGATYLLVEVGSEVWLASVPPGQEGRAGQFATWINTVSQHYRYR
ncbi:DUF2510 domain-containing protein [Microbacterium rhizomatis]|uniref:DUF2510 domain-containing protein n=1 Tax=Microbacterium rhizomatis TaxID=1631477 RepID=A0A5J5J2I2_9MICO|nr:DUF2510 domain-containing protein [Microbacterium rhizomatis]KAA9107623.1 DUF2510 domain-containing protein [Microbacterium rhizomatis]